MIYIIDMDGTLYHGRTPIEYAKEFIQYLQNNNRRFIMVTNCPSSTADDLVLKLARMGIRIDEDNILTSGQVTASFVAGNKTGAKVHMIGSNALRNELEKRGAEIVTTEPDFVIVGFDRKFSYGKMKRATRYILEGAKFIVTNNDYTIPEGNTTIPHTGAIAAGIEKATGVKPLVIGKPEKYILDAVIEKLDCSKEECCIIGDRLDTDIVMGTRCGMSAYLVMTGVTSHDLLKNSAIQLDRVFESLKELMDSDRDTYSKLQGDGIGLPSLCTHA